MFMMYNARIVAIGRKVTHVSTLSYPLWRNKSRSSAAATSRRTRSYEIIDAKQQQQQN